MEERVERKTDKGLFFSIVGVLTLIVAIIGATYAWFAAADNDSNTITGTAATAGLDLAISPILTPGDLIPQKGSAINNAVNSTNNCEDSTGNAICQVYKLTVTNTGNAKIVVNGTISFANIANMPNLVWSKSTTERSGYATVGTNATAAAAALDTGVSIAGGAKHEFYLAVWIEEANEEQSDSGTFTATVTYNSSDGNGVTSTITS